MIPEEHQIFIGGFIGILLGLALLTLWGIPS